MLLFGTGCFFLSDLGYWSTIERERIVIWQARCIYVGQIKSIMSLSYLGRRRGKVILDDIHAGWALVI